MSDPVIDAAERYERMQEEAAEAQMGDTDALIEQIGELGAQASVLQRPDEGGVECQACEADNDEPCLCEEPSYEDDLAQRVAEAHAKLECLNVRVVFEEGDYQTFQVMNSVRFTGEVVSFTTWDQATDKITAVMIPMARIKTITVDEGQTAEGQLARQFREQDEEAAARSAQRGGGDDEVGGASDFLRMLAERQGR